MAKLKGKRYFKCFENGGVLSFEWSPIFRNLGGGITLASGDSGEGVKVDIHIPFLSIWLGVEHPLIRRFFQLFRDFDYCSNKKSKEWTAGWGREISLEIDFQNHWIKWAFFSYPMNGIYRNGIFNYLDWLFGRSRHTERQINSGSYFVTMPEKRYPATYRIYDSTWQRPRLPFPKTIRRIEIEVPDGIPVPGKGENSWDCGDDAVFAVTMPIEAGETAWQAANRFAFDCLKTRQRYAALDWLPKEIVQV